FNIDHSSLDHTFYPKSVSKKTGGAARPMLCKRPKSIDFGLCLGWNLEWNASRRHCELPRDRRLHDHTPKLGPVPFNAGTTRQYGGDGPFPRVLYQPTDLVFEDFGRVRMDG
ncbi:hypothetical protein, partial [Caballeronia calidae]|uniref:hypothetical protein n=1 Tax=Caballeronia calidae TaxID=1777139 RepID=UPI001E48F714